MKSWEEASGAIASSATTGSQAIVFLPMASRKATVQMKLANTSHSSKCMVPELAPPAA